MKTTFFIALAGVAGMSLLTGCETNKVASNSRPYYIGIAPRDAEQAPAPAPAPAKSEPVKAAPMSPLAANELAFPTGDKATSAILLRQRAPASVKAGSPYDINLDVINLTSGVLQNVVVSAESLSNLGYVSSVPPFSKSADGDAIWAIGDLGPNATKTIVIKGQAEKVGVASNCLSVSYANVLCVSTQVVQPALQITKTATPEICGTCEEIKLTYEVKNSGSGDAENVMIKDTLPAGLTVDGKNVVERSVGTLGSGQSKQVVVTAKAASAGEFKSGASASATGGLAAQSGVPATVVKQPQLTVACQAPAKVFVGRDITYTFTVKNPGNCAASGAMVSAPLPSGTNFVSADNNGKAEGGKVVWNLGSVGAGETKTLTMKVKPTGMGSTPVTATASATCVPVATTNCSTEIAGIPAILLEVVDTDDPVEVGGTTTFIVTATNQGSAADTNVKVVCTLPAGMEFVSGSGASAVSANGSTVTMAAVPTVAAKAKAEWRIVVRAKAEGDVRSKWSLTSDQFKTPVEETESTNLYK
jgi:uncharacterized repeat protein (TIGR01451 family)